MRSRTVGIRGAMRGAEALMAAPSEVGEKWRKEEE